MARHKRPKYRGRHARPSTTANIAKTAGTLGIAATAAVATASVAHAAPLPAGQVAAPQVAQVATASHLAYVAHLAHLRHLEHLAHLAQEHALVNSWVPAVLDVHAGIFSPSAIGALWLAAGGSPAAESVAECIAHFESGGNSNAISPTADYGLMQINASWGPAMASLNPLVNMEAAVKISHDGTDWSPWATAWDCGV